MAIVPSHPGIAVTIHDAANNDKANDNTAKKEYDVPPADAEHDITSPANAKGAKKTPIVTKYIEAATDAPFRICWTFLPTLSRAFLQKWDLQARVFVDGTLVEDRLFLSCELRADEGPDGWCTFMDGPTKVGRGGDGWRQSQFVFRRLHIDDGHGGAASKKAVEELKDLGQIRIEMFRVEEYAEGKGSNQRWAKVRKRDSVPEEAVKGKSVSHGIGLMQEQRISGMQVGKVRAVDDEAFAIFEFRYRSLDDLRSLHVVKPPMRLEDMKWTDMSKAQKLTFGKRLYERVIRWEKPKPEKPDYPNESDDEPILVKVTFGGAQATKPTITRQQNTMIQAQSAARPTKAPTFDNTAKQHIASPSKVRTEQNSTTQQRTSTKAATAQTQKSARKERLLKMQAAAEPKLSRNTYKAAKPRAALKPNRTGEKRPAPASHAEREAKVPRQHLGAPFYYKREESYGVYPVELLEESVQSRIDPRLLCVEAGEANDSHVPNAQKARDKTDGRSQWK